MPLSFKYYGKSKINLSEQVNLVSNVILRSEATKNLGVEELTFDTKPDGL